MTPSHWHKTLILFLLSALAWVADAQTFELLRVQNVVQGRRFALTFRLSNAQANPPAAPQLQHCRLFSGPEISTMEYQVNNNGQVSHTVMYDFTYVYIADETGNVSVPALTVNAGGKKLSSRAASFTILPPDKEPDPRSAQGQAPRHPGQSSRPSPKMSASDLLVRVSFSKNSVYEQEAVVASIKVYTKLEIKDFRVVQQPEFEGFLSEELPVSNRVQLENYNGSNYYSAELKKCLLYPQKSGTLRLKTGIYDVTVVHQEPVSQGFWVTMRETEEHATTVSNAASLQVKPLPEPRPAGFSGAVGHFNLATELNPELMRTNEASTYSVIIRGTGNIKYIPQPEIDFPASFDKYTPKTDIQANIVGSNTTGTYRVDYPVVPQEVGKFEIPPYLFIYFDPQSGKYETLESKAYPVNVARGAAAAPAPQQAVNAEMDDIRHIHLTGADSPRPGQPVFGTLGYWLGYVVLIVALIVVVLVYRRHARLNADVAGRRLARAARMATRRLKVAASFMKAHQPDKFYEELARALKGYIGDKLAIAPSQLISDTISERLAAAGVGEDTVAQAIDILNYCEMARFTPDSGADSTMADTYRRASDTVQAIEKEMKK